MEKLSFTRMVKQFCLLSFVFAFNTQIFAACTEDTRECAISAAKAYLSALVTHEASQVPFDEYVQRFENGVNTGKDAKTLRKGLENDIGFKSILGVRDVRFVVDGSQVIAFYLIDNALPYTQNQVGTTHVVERFQVEKGLITEIEAVFCTSPNPNPEESKMYPKHHTSILCSRSLI